MNLPGLILRGLVIVVLAIGGGPMAAQTAWRTDPAGICAKGRTLRSLADAQCCWQACASAGVHRGNRKSRARLHGSRGGL